MTTSKSIALASVAFLWLGGAVLAEDIRGVVKKVDAEKSEMVIELRLGRPRGVPIAFTVNKDTKILVGSEIAELSEIPVGSRVRVQFETRNGQKVASGVSVRGSKIKAGTIAAGENVIGGTIQRIIFTEREIVVTSPGPDGKVPLETTVTVPESAKITRDAKSIKLDDLREGEKVAIRTENRDGKLAAVTVQAGVEVRPAVDNSKRVEQIRQVLRLADFFLQQMSKPK
jgi:hypothetical protein